MFRKFLEKLSHKVPLVLTILLFVVATLMLLWNSGKEIELSNELTTKNAELQAENAVLNSALGKMMEHCISIAAHCIKVLQDSVPTSEETVKACASGKGSECLKLLQEK